MMMFLVVVAVTVLVAMGIMTTTNTGDCALPTSSRYIEFLLAPAVRDYGEAAAQMAIVVSEDAFVSKKGKSTHRLWMDLCALRPHAARARVVVVPALLRCSRGMLAGRRTWGRGR